MRWAGFVLAGGNSTRMGQDKAELSFRGMPLGLWVARQVEQAAGNVTLVGGGHRDWGIPMLCDPEPGLGPLAGVVAALRASQADWNLIAACDLPGVTAGLLAKLVACAEERGKMALVPIHRNGNREPLCAAYHRGVLPFAESALGKT